MVQQKYLPGKPREPVKAIAVCLMVFVVAFLAYAGTLLGDFVWDDEYLVINNSNIKSFTHLPDVFKTYAGYGSGNVNNFYRPLQEVSNMVDYHLWGEAPMGFHLTNTTLHALVAVVVFIFLLCLSGNILVAGLASLFYAVHPVHTEAVAYIAGRADPLYTLFMLLSLIMFILSSKRISGGKNGAFFYIFSLLFFIMSLLCKETAITLPLIVGLYIVFFLKGGASYKSLKFAWVPYAVICCAYVFMRMTVLDFSHNAPGSIFTSVPLAYRILTFLRSIGIYLRVLALPVDLHMERTMAITKGLFEPAALMALGATLVAAWGVWYTYRRNRLISFAIVWFFVNLLPFSNVVPLNSFLAEHWLYAASIGVFLLVAMGIVQLYNYITAPKIRITFICIIGIIVGIYAALTVIRNAEWSDEIVFYESTLKYHPMDTRVYLNLGNAYYERGDLERAIEEYLNVIALDKNYAVAYGNIGTIALRLGDWEKAEKNLKKAIQLKSDYPIAYYNLGLLRMEQKRYKEAVAYLEKATGQMPQFYQAWDLIGRSYMELGDTQKAKKAFIRSLEILPSQVEVKHILSQI